MKSFVLSFSIFAAVFFAVPLFSRETKKPNVVFVLTDQWRASAFGHAGDPNVKTPRIDSLAAQSIRFGNAVSVCPVCTPSRASLETGRYPTTTGMFVNDIALPSTELCMGDIYKAAGYDTAHIGKWHIDGHGRDAYIPPERRHGYDYWKSAECDHNYQKSHYYEGTSREKKFWDGYDAFAQTADAQTWLESRQGIDKPFLLMLSYGTPHFPHNNAPEEYQAMYPPDKLKLAPNVTPDQIEFTRKELAGYYAHCTALDKCVGDLCDTLRKSGLDENTILVFTSDHGDMMGGHGIRSFMKQWPYDESAHVPFLLRCPNSVCPEEFSKREIATPIDTPDILPTLLGLCGLEIPKTIEGDDLSSIVRSGGAGPDRAALIMCVSPFIPFLVEYRGVRTERYTFVRNLERPWMLFDNHKDPWQRRNLVSDPAFAELRNELDGKLQAELTKIGDAFKPREFYLEKWGYRIDPYGDGSVSYKPGSPVQGPGINTERGGVPAQREIQPGIPGNSRP